MTLYLDNYELAATQLVAELGNTIVIGIPLGLGKPIGFINALYRHVEANPHLSLTIITALTLARPDYKNSLERRFIEPLLNRILGDFEDPLYEHARVNQTLPKNIHVMEFFLSPGKYLGNAYVQQNYINSNYTNVARDILHYGLNAIAQLVSPNIDDVSQFSVSSNSDLFSDVVSELRQLEKQTQQKIAVVAEVNRNMPFMLGDAVVSAQIFTHIIAPSVHKDLFAMPSYELALEDHAIGLYCSTLVKDDSCLQIGIGKLSNAAAHALILRDKNNTHYKNVLTAVNFYQRFEKSFTTLGDDTPFKQGLYASTEMFSDGYWQLFRKGILKKKVYDDLRLQQLLNEKLIDETVSSNTLNQFIKHNVIHNKLTDDDMFFLQRFGFVSKEAVIDNDSISVNNQTVSRDISTPQNREELINLAPATQLLNGVVLHGGFFLGTKCFYQALRELKPDERPQINMTAIARTNLLSWNPELLALQRTNARFINSAMIVTLGGVVVSDGLADLQEVSGVGGQFDFIDMAHKLPGARSIITCPSTRRDKKGLKSNIVWAYPNVTVPRYLRDIVVTEYGIADCRSKTDCETIQAILTVTDSRFQDELMAAAKKAGKLNLDHQIPNEHRQNYPQVLAHNFKHFENDFPAYPFGTELTADELVLQKALVRLKNASKWQLAKTLLKGMRRKNKAYRQYLARMELLSPTTFRDAISQKILVGSLD